MTGVYAAVMNVGTKPVTFATAPISVVIGWRWATSILAGRCQLLADLIRQRHSLDTWIAAGERAAGLAGMHSSYRHAATALRIGPMLDPDARVFAVAALRVPQLVATTAGHERSEYAASSLPDCATGPTGPPSARR
jgi:carbohydrate diacid regulator